MVDRDLLHEQYWAVLRILSGPDIIVFAPNKSTVRAAPSTSGKSTLPERLKPQRRAAAPLHNL
jgi:hypothetical protein